MRKTGLKNLFRALHPTTPLPRTYDRGTLCLDFVLASNDAIKLVQAMGYLPFYELGPDDHRSLFLDLYYDKIRSKQCMEDATQATDTTPSLRRPAKMRKFIERYKMMLEKADIFNKVEKIKNRFEKASAREQQHLQARLDKYDEVWVQLAKSALKKMSMTYTGHRAWSPTFAKKGAICRYWNQRLRQYYTTGILNSENVPTPPKFEPPTIQTAEELVRYHSDALQAWHKVKGNAAELQVQHLEDLIQYYMEQRNVKREIAVKQLLLWEEVQNLHS